MKIYPIITVLFLLFASLFSFAEPAVDYGYDEAIDAAISEGDPDNWVTDPNSEIENREEGEDYDPVEYKYWNKNMWFFHHRLLVFILTFLAIGLVWLLVKPPMPKESFFTNLFANFFMRTIYILPITIVAFGVEYLIFLGWKQFFNDLVDTVFGLIGLVLIGGFLFWGFFKGGFETTHSTGPNCSSCRHNRGGSPCRCSIHGYTKSSVCENYER